MENVYDLVAVFYDNDEEWNTVLQRNSIEGFLRHEAWCGRNDKELQREWQQVLMLCLYLGHSDCQVGDLSADDVIDAVAWCGRNVDEFIVDYEHISFYLEVLGRLFSFLKDRKSITSAIAPQLAKEKLLREDGSVCIIDSGGEYLPGEHIREKLSTPDAPAKVFLNIEDSLTDLLDELRCYFQRDCFTLDLERALFFYRVIYSDAQIECCNDDFMQCFWDYFLFDYHLLEYDKTPLQHFCLEGKSKKTALLKELAGTQLTIFVVQGQRSDGFYLCQDFLTNEEYLLSLPLDSVESTELKDMLFVGHIFYNKGMAMNYINCIKANKLVRKSLREHLMRCYERYKIQEPQDTLTGFIARNPMLARHLSYFDTDCLQTDRFLAKKEAFRPVLPVKPMQEDEVMRSLQEVLLAQHFSCRDVVLAKRMWRDFSEQGIGAVRKTEVWVAGIIENFIMLNDVYSYSNIAVSEMCRNVPVQSLKKAAKEIWQALQIEKYDPRYCNEEGFLKMLFSKEF